MKRFEKSIKIFKEWIVFTLIFFFLYDIIWAIADFEDFIQSLEDFYFWLFMDFVYCGSFSLISLSTNKKLLSHRLFKQAETNHKKFIRSVVIIVAVNILIAGACEMLLEVINPDFVAEDVWGTFFLLGIISSLLTLIHLLLHYSNVIVHRNNEKNRLQKKYLMLQLDPHFVFNSLSSLAGMIGEEPQRAEEYVVRLSQVYRYMLRNIDQDYTTINETINFAETYIRLLNLRYNDQIILETDDVKVNGNDKILALSLQLLIENAVKHNSPQENQPLCIQISVRDKMFVIKNNRIYTNGNNNQIIESYGIGLKNLKQRYELECMKRIEYNVTHDSFEVRLPIITKQ